MSLAHRPCRWSSQFGLYKYKEQELDLEWSHKNDMSYKKRLQIIFLLTVVLISVLVVVLVVMDVTSVINGKVAEKKNRQGRQINEDISYADALRSNSNIDETVTKENTSFLNIVANTTENYNYEEDELLAESKISNNELSHPKPFQSNDNKLFPQLSNYRNSEKFESLDQLVMYMNHRLHSNNINANPNRKIKFSGVYFHPVDNDKKIQNRKLKSRKHKEIQFSELPTGFKSIYPIDRNQGDPFYSYKPKQPGDINLLADKLFRFSPNRTNYRDTEASLIKPCDHILGDYSEVSKLTVSDRARGEKKQKPLSVMLDIYPMDDQDEEIMAFPPHLKQPVLTTRKPKIKHRPNYFNRPQVNPYYYYNGYQPNYYEFNRQQISNRMPVPNVQNNANQGNDNVPTKMLLQLNLYPRKKIIKQFKFGDDTYDIIDRKFEEPMDRSDSNNDTIRRSMIGNMLEKFNKDRNVVNDEYLDNITMEDIKNGYGFKLPGPKLIKSDYPDGISESVVRLLSLPNNLTKNRVLRDGGENRQEKEKEIPNNVPLSHRVANNSFFVLPLVGE